MREISINLPKKCAMIFALVSSFSSLAIAETLSERRCHREDSLELDIFQGRVAWARKCKFTDDLDVQVQLKNKMYPSFHHTDGRTKAPIDPKASCDGWTSDGGFWCTAGCYTPDQEVLFGGSYLKIEDAVKQSEASVTALTKDATLDKLQYAEQEIKAFTIGDTKETVYRFTTANQLSLEVTDIHPMIKSDGSVVKASNLVVGDKLISRDGKEESVIKIDTRMFEGTVYNVTPVSEDKLENILVAQELLTGSNRFQNEWVNTDWRMQMRRSADVSMF